MDGGYDTGLERFRGAGMNFTAKLIGVLEVNEPRGERMCQSAISRLKQNVINSRAHKQKIIVNVSLNGIRIYDQKSRVSFCGDT